MAKLNIHVHHGGDFREINQKIVYDSQKVLVFSDVDPKEVTYKSLYGNFNPASEFHVPYLWYIKKGMPMNTGRTIIDNENDVKAMLKAMGKDNILKIYLTLSRKLYRKIPWKNLENQKAISSTSPYKRPSPTKKPIEAIPLRRSPRKLKTKNQAKTTSNIPFEPSLPLTIRQKLPFRKPALVKEKENVVVNEKGIVFKEVDCLGGKANKVHVKGKGKEVVQVDVEEHVKGMGNGCYGKGKGPSGGKGKRGKGPSGGKGKRPSGGKGTDKALKRKEVVDDYFDVEEIVDDYFDVEDLSDDSEYSDLDIEFEVGEEDLRAEDVFEKAVDKSIFDQIDTTLGGGQGLGQGQGQGQGEEYVWSEGEEDSDELRSFDGSDEEFDETFNYPMFGQEVDYGRNVKLSLGLKFPSNVVLRKALVHQSVDTNFDFYYLHNGINRVTSYCRYRCKCPWDQKRSKIKCKCEERRCYFKVHARRITENGTFQIKGLHLRHTCKKSLKTRKVSSEYLAERYLEEWRDNPKWDLKAFILKVKRDTGYDVTYALAWSARCRIRLIINGDASEQYGRVWDYVAAVSKYNAGSSAIVVVENIERLPPYFQRMYICLKACKEGWLAGCRPILGVDGCHLKGQFPGMCLVAVGMDGNNNIYPIAWGVVDVENMSTWTWFLRLLIEDLQRVEGEGLTFMSDRQKGLVDAFTSITPKAHIRFCARHIWANFKLRFSGDLYKECFWKAARSTSKADFDAEMEGLKFLNPSAHSYLAAIPAEHWSRHAFSTTSKSNMLLNNMCETFNNVIKEARGKPILTHMEWMRRYVMRRRCEKREGVKGLQGDFMPYVTKCLKWADDQSRFCTLTQSSDFVYEVDYRGDTFVVDLDAKTCSCFHWNLTGLPCPHAMGCILDKRDDIDSYIHEAYSKAAYTRAFEPSVSPMPSAKHWPQVPDQLQPQPPPFKKLPGRPNSKKRKKEADEGTSKSVQKNTAPGKCGNCGGSGHNARTCNNPQAAKAPGKPRGRPSKNSSFTRKRLPVKPKATKPRVPEGESMVASTSGVTSARISSATTRSQANQGHVDLVNGSQASVTRGV